MNLLLLVMITIHTVLRNVNFNFSPLFYSVHTKMCYCRYCFFTGARAMSGMGDVKQVEGDVPMDTENSTQREVRFHFRDFVIWVI